MSHGHTKNYLFATCTKTALCLYHWASIFKVKLYPAGIDKRTSFETNFTECDKRNFIVNPVFRAAVFTAKQIDDVENRQ